VSNEILMGPSVTNGGRAARRLPKTSFLWDAIASKLKRHTPNSLNAVWESPHVLVLILRCRRSGTALLEPTGEQALHGHHCGGFLFRIPPLRKINIQQPG